MFDINALINNAITTAVAEAIKPLVARIEALENIAAEYTPAPAVTIDEAKMVAALDSQEGFWHKVAGFVTNNSEITANDLEILKDRVGALESRRDASGLSKSAVEALIERAMDSHTEEFNHDSYDEVMSTIEDIDFDDFAKTDDIKDAVRDAVQDLSFEIRVR